MSVTPPPNQVMSPAQDGGARFRDSFDMFFVFWTQQTDIISGAGCKHQTHLKSAFIDINSGDV